jgi:hypothetical protein
MNSGLTGGLTAAPLRTVATRRVGKDTILMPDANGAIIAGPAPDNTAKGGHARGSSAVDLQATRTAATQIASGEGSTNLGTLNTVSGQYSFAVGRGNVASGGGGACALGMYSIASGNSSFSIGYSVAASGGYSIASGYGAAANQPGMRAHAGGRIYAQGATQLCEFHLAQRTTDATPTQILLYQHPSGIGISVAAGCVMNLIVLVAGSNSARTKAAVYARKVAIRNFGGTTQLVGSVETIGTDAEDDASTDISINANDTTDRLEIWVTGIAAENWQWSGVAYGAMSVY